jgi:serine/threonine protein kinase/Tfp pilus assembly protein PilF
MAHDADADEGETRSFLFLTKDSLVGHYKIIDKIGSGGMGEIYSAEDTRLNRKVALKVLPADCCKDESLKARFYREAQAAAKLSHPNIITVYEINEYEGRPYFAMEHIEGLPLDKYVDEKQPTLSGIIDLSLQIADGLGEAHRGGIIHRDIKPSNILVDNHGRVRILDFGLAAIKGAKKITRSGSTMGTVNYMSPEQTRGEKPDYRSDIFSFGIVLYEMITGRLPFKGEHEPAIMNAIAQDEPEPLAHYKSGTPGELQRIVGKMLFKDPSYRYQSTADLAADLRSIRDRVSSRGFITPRKRRWRQYVVAAGAIILVLIAGHWIITSYITPEKAQAERRLLAVLPFLDMTLKPESSGWTGIIQTLIASNLTGASEFGVVDPMSLNMLIEGEFDSASPARNQKLYDLIRQRNVSYIIDGAIVRAGDSILVQASMIKPLTGEQIFSHEERIGGENDLSRAAQSLAQNIYDYLQTQMLQSGHDRDLQPWLSHRATNLGALKAFMQANQFIFNGMPGSDNYLRQAIEIDSLFVAPRIWLISGLVALGKLDEARTHYETLRRHEAEANPFEQAMIGWAGAFIAGDNRAQINALRLALTYSPNNNILLYQLARCQCLSDDYQGAIATLTPAIEMRWKFQTAYYLVGSSYFALKQYDKARKILESSLSLPFIHPYTYGLLSGLSLYRGDSIAALKYENSFIKQSEDQRIDPGQIYYMLGNNYRNMGTYPASIRCFQTAISLRPSVAEYHANLGEVLFLMNRVQKAEEELSQSIRLDSNSLYSYQILAEINENKGDTLGAMEYYRLYIARDSISSQAAEIMRRMARLRR